MVKAKAMVNLDFVDAGDIIEIDPQDKKIRHYLEAGVLKLVGGPVVYTAEGRIGLSSGT
jgi:hypothetical protein